MELPITSGIFINTISVPCSFLSKNQSFYEEIDLIENWIIYSIIKILYIDWDDEFDLEMEIPDLIYSLKTIKSH
jgi:hypothetical protein